MGAPFFFESLLSLLPPPTLPAPPTPQPPDLQMLEREKASEASLHHLQGLRWEKGVFPAKGREEQGQTETRFPGTGSGAASGPIFTNKTMHSVSFEIPVDPRAILSTCSRTQPTFVLRSKTKSTGHTKGSKCVSPSPLKWGTACPARDQSGPRRPHRAHRGGNDGPGDGGVEAGVPGADSGGESLGPMDPDTGRKPHSQSPAARLETVPAGGPRLVSGECDGMHSRKFFLISDCVYLLLFLFRSMPVN